MTKKHKKQNYKAVYRSLFYALVVAVVVGGALAVLANQDRLDGIDGRLDTIEQQQNAVIRYLGSTQGLIAQ